MWVCSAIRSSCRSKWPHTFVLIEPFVSTLHKSYDKENVPGPGHYQPSTYGTIPRAANLSNKLEPKRHLRYLKRNDEDPPRRFKFIDDPVDEPVKKKRSGK